MIRYLEKSEFGACRPLWQEAFPEDSREFADYYFDKKILQSSVLVKEDGTGRIVTMAHMNPYRINMGKKMWKLDYIVGVATAADSRHRGHMRDVLMKMLGDMHQDRKPFCYLMPASPDIYRPFGFRYIFDQPQYRLGSEAKECLQRRELRLDGNLCSSLAGWMNHWLSSRYQVYALRDRDYMEMLQSELDSEAGSVYGWYDVSGSLQAFQAFWGREKQEQRFLYAGRDRWLEPASGQHAPRPAIMARITDVRSFMEAIVLDEGCPCPAMDVMVNIHDPLIPGNSGLWRWKIDGNGSSLTKKGVSLPKIHTGECAEEPDYPGTLVSTEVLDITIEQLASWLFGYSVLEELAEGEQNGVPFWCAYVQVLDGVYLDEVV